MTSPVDSQTDAPAGRTGDEAPSTPSTPSASSKESAETTPPEDPLCHRTPAYFVTQHFVNLMLRIFCRRRVLGRDHLPREGGFLLVSNHQSFLDIPLIASAAGPRHVCFVARDSLARSKPLAWLMRRCGAVLVRRGAADRAALKEMVAHLQRGDLVTIFPEGTRSPDGSLGEFKGGALVAARRAKVPILTVGIRGTVEAWPRGKSAPRPTRVSVEFGSVIEPTRKDALEAVRADIERMVGDGRFASSSSESGEARDGETRGATPPDSP